MCGIAGAWQPYVLLDPLSLANAAATMAQAVIHRGPDGAGFFATPRVALAHRRLAIHDRSERGLQPMVAREGDLVIAVNGTFHNAPDLRAREELLGATFTSRSDSEVLLPLYRRLGTACLKELRGPFALAVFDRRDGSIFLARDRLGEKPLFYTWDGSILHFASEVAALRRAVPSRALNRNAARAFLQCGYVPAPDTLFDGIVNLPPASFLRLGPETSESGRYWTPPLETDEGMDAGRADQLVRQVLSEAIVLRTRTDRELGVLLSGGLDSASVLALAGDAAGAPLPSFTLGFPVAALDERSRAKMTAEALGSQNSDSLFDVDPAPLLERLIATTGEALADASWLALALLVERTPSETTVLLCGDGGDEVLLGYRRHLLADAAERMNHPLAQAGLAALAPFVPGARLRKAVAALREGRHGALADLAGLLPRSGLRAIVADFPDPDPLTALYATLPRAADGARPSGIEDLMTYLPGDLLPKADRAAMLSGKELWSPFLDHVVVETLLRIPRHLRRRGGRGKQALRTLLRDRVPAEVLAARKRGFGVPLARWLQAGSYATFARTVLGDFHSLFDGLVIGSDPLPLLRRLQEGETSLAPLVHATVVLALASTA